MHSEARWAQTAKPDLQHLPIRVGRRPPALGVGSVRDRRTAKADLAARRDAVAHLPHHVARARPTGAARRRAAALGISAAWFFTPARSAHRRRRRPRLGTVGVRHVGRVPGMGHIECCLLDFTLTASTDVSGPQRTWSPSVKLNPAAAMCSRDVLPRCPAAAMCLS